MATKISEGKPEQAKINGAKVRELLGRVIFRPDDELSRRTSVPGVATGLAWTPAGGEVLFIEATRMPGSKGYIITGSVGNVMQESAQAALSYIRAHAEDYGLPSDFFEKSDIHLHVPAGAQPKDGPSAGVTMATALVSLLTGRAVRSDVGDDRRNNTSGTGYARGRHQRKGVGRARFGLKTLILPRLNEPDTTEVPEEAKKSIKFIFVDTVDQVIKNALVRPTKTKKAEKDS